MGLKEYSQWVAGTWSANWKLLRSARNLPEILIDRGILQGRAGGKEKIRMTESMTVIFFTAGGQGPQWPRA